VAFLLSCLPHLSLLHWRGVPVPGFGGLLAALFLVNGFLSLGGYRCKALHLPSIGVQAGKAVYFLRLELKALHVLLRLFCIARLRKSRQARRSSRKKLAMARRELAHGETSSTSSPQKKALLFGFICFWARIIHPIGLDFWACSYSPTTQTHTHRRCFLEARLTIHAAARLLESDAVRGMAAHDLRTKNTRTVESGWFDT